MKKLFSLVALFIICFTAAGQYYDSTKSLTRNNTSGFDWNNSKVRGAQMIPTDTFKLAVKDSGAIAYKNGYIYSYNGYIWTVLTPASYWRSSTTNNIDNSNTGNVGIGTTTPISKFQVNGTIRGSDSLVLTGLLRSASSGDSVLVKTSTGVVKSIAQSAISGVNIYNSDGTLTGNRIVSGGATYGITFTDNNFVNINADDVVDIAAANELHLSGQDSVVIESNSQPNTKLVIPRLPSGIPSGAKRLLISTGGQLYAADTTAGGGGGTPSLTTNEIGVGVGGVLGSYATFNVDIPTFSLRLGQGDLTPTYVNFLGSNAGSTATNANRSNFLGLQAGNGATNADGSNFLGTSAGEGAENASKSNFLGTEAGTNATNASSSNFIGDNVGYTATNALRSNFLGFRTGYDAINSSYSNLFGYNVGMASVGDTLGSNNIIIGTNISMPNGTANSMNLGAVLYGTGFYSTTTGTPRLTALTTGKIGINTSTPSTALHVIGAIKATDSISFTGLLPMSAGTDSVVVRDTNGKLGTTAKSAFGSTYSAGYGLSLASTTFSADSSVLMTKGTTQVVSGNKYHTGNIILSTAGTTDGSVATINGTQTLTNKRWTARVGSTTSSATPTINTDNTDIYKLTAQAADITSFTTNLSGTPVDGDILEIQVTGTAARAITWGASFVASTVALPTTTVTTATLTIIFQYYTTSSYGNNKWICVNYY